MESFEKGTKRLEGIINIIDLHGTWREMGRQYGALMASGVLYIVLIFIVGTICCVLCCCHDVDAFT